MALAQHPQIFLSPAKDLYYFDRYYDRGVSWYASQFRGATPQHRVVGEVCPDYLACPDAPKRITADLGRPRVMVTLREPAERAFSSYLYMLKHGEGETTFRATLQTRPELLEHGRYATQLSRFLEHLDRDQLLIALFDDLKADPQAFTNQVVRWLGLTPMTLDESALESRLPASGARFVPLARAIRTAARVVRDHDGAKLVGKVKGSPLTHRLLYKQLGDRAPRLSAEDAMYVREQLDSEVRRLETDFGIPVMERWGWSGS
jgi:hypothetical protein